MEDRQKHFERPTMYRPPSLFNLTLLASILGVVAGFGGYLLAKNLIPITDIDYFGLLNTDRNIKVTLEQPLTSLGQAQATRVAGVYRQTPSIAALGAPLFSQSDFLGSATVITSDGWLMTTDQVVDDDQAKVLLNDQIYDIKELKTDPFLKLVFIKIEAGSLSPVAFQLADDIKIGERIYSNIDLANTYDHFLTTGLLTNIHFEPEVYLSTETPDYYLTFEAKDQPKLATPYFNMDHNLLGIIYQRDDQMVLLPAEYIKQSIKHLLNNTQRPTLGIRYVDLENNSGFDRKGNLVYNPKSAPITVNSPAYKAGLRAGDQIVAINNDLITKNRTLTSIIQNYRVGDKVIIKIARDGVEQDIEVQL